MVARLNKHFRGLGPFIPLPLVLDAIVKMTDEMPEPKDGAAWSGADIRDLKWLLENGTSIDDVARLLRRATNVIEVEAKALELGLEILSRSLLIRSSGTGLVNH
jgi:hypothetical protein